MTATTTPLTELMALVDGLRRLDDHELIAAWRANDAAIAQSGRLGGADQARFRHYAFRLAALERFGFIDQAHLRHGWGEGAIASSPTLSADHHP